MTFISLWLTWPLTFIEHRASARFRPQRSLQLQRGSRLATGTRKRGDQAIDNPPPPPRINLEAHLRRGDLESRDRVAYSSPDRSWKKRIDGFPGARGPGAKGREAGGPVRN